MYYPYLNLVISSQVSNLAIVITDGRPTLNQEKWEEEAERLKNSGVFVMAVGITNQIDNSTLRYSMNN